MIVFLTLYLRSVHPLWKSTISTVGTTRWGSPTTATASRKTISSKERLAHQQILGVAWFLYGFFNIVFVIVANRKSQLVEDRKIYVRRVSSNVCDLRKASRPLSTNVEPGAGLFETFLEVALFYDRHQHLHTPYIKSSYPNPVTVRLLLFFFLLKVLFDRLIIIIISVRLLFFFTIIVVGCSCRCRTFLLPGFDTLAATPTDGQWTVHNRSNRFKRRPNVRLLPSSSSRRSPDLHSHHLLFVKSPSGGRFLQQGALNQNR